MSRRQPKNYPKELKIYVIFANQQEEDIFIHPIVRSILLHFFLAYEHPFVDGNGRTARALFYWNMIKQNYDLMALYFYFQNH